MTDEEYPVFTGPIVQWPKYGATYRGQQFVVSPVPTEDGRWVLTVNDWTDRHLYATITAAIDAGLDAIKRSADASPSSDGDEADETPVS